MVMGDTLVRRDVSKYTRSIAPRTEKRTSGIAGGNGCQTAVIDLCVRLSFLLALKLEAKV
jgi:hypothetical protein